MSVIASSIPSGSPVPSGGRQVNAPRFDNGAQWLASLGDVPLDRVIFDPWPGTATERDLLLFVERGNRLCELVDGTLVEKPVGLREAKIGANIVSSLNAFVLPRALGGVYGADATMRLSAGRIRLPDVSFIATAREPDLSVPIPAISPDLAVEVLSPTNTRREMQEKLREYFESGTRLAWYVDPESRTVRVYTGVDGEPVVVDETGHLDGGEVLPGLSVPVNEIFRGIARRDT